MQVFGEKFNEFISFFAFLYNALRTNIRNDVINFAQKK